jgi:D-cysteine desulfhydrase
VSDKQLLFRAPTRRRFARTPTPIHHLAALSKMLGAHIFCKRDDLTGFGFGGNKVRKLEYLLSEIARGECDCIVTCGSNQSNWCCAASVAGAVLGMDVYLVLGGAAPRVDTGNLRLERIAGARVSHVETTDDDVLERASAELTRSLAADGRKPYRMLMGGSTALGSLGYVNALGEVIEYEKDTNTRFRRIFHATGSGGTQAGLVAGSLLFDWPGEIIGIATSRASARQRQKVGAILGQMFTAETAGSAKVIVDDSFVGAGYRHKTDECAEAIEIFARVEGLFLDEVYTGKAAAGLIQYARTGRLPRNESVLFLHTGGSAQLFE